MFKMIVGLFVVSAVSLTPVVSNAATDNGTFWAMCGSCTTRSSFIEAGQAFYSSRPSAPHVMNLSVGNPDTGKVYFMQIVGNVGGGIGTPVPASVPSQSPTVGPGTVLVTAEPMSTNVTPQMVMSSYSSSGSQVGEAYEQTAVEPTFQTVGVAYKNQFLFNVSSQDAQNPAFASFESATDSGMAQLSKLVWAAEETHNPGFTEALSKASTSMLAAWNALKDHGILVSVIFANGDVATFEINALTGEIIYIKGTAKDWQGNLLPDYTPNLGGGGYGDVGVQPTSPPSATYSIDGTQGIRCAFVDGVLSYCIVVTL
ncbi:MAG TPA: hypothetical protein VFY97_00100 [Rhodanobacteraceae bacterium]|nr:hypothetical protein [Rhodanobacteraceae bacterium]